MKGIFSGIKPKVTSDQTSGETCYLLYTVRKRIFPCLFLLRYCTCIYCTK